MRDRKTWASLGGLDDTHPFEKCARERGLAYSELSLKKDSIPRSQERGKVLGESKDFGFSAVLRGLP